MFRRLKGQLDSTKISSDTPQTYSKKSSVDRSFMFKNIVRSRMFGFFGKIYKVSRSKLREKVGVKPF